MGKPNMKCKLITIGDATVGKTAVIRRFTHNEFSTNYTYTIGIDLETRTVSVCNKPIDVQVWDTAGQERHQAWMPIPYYRSASGVLIVYDITQRTSFHNIENWVQKFRRYANDNVEVILVGNKCDLQHERQVERSEGEQFAQDHDISFIETSAKENINVERAFMDILSAIATKNMDREMELSRSPATSVGTKMQAHSCC